MEFGAVPEDNGAINVKVILHLVINSSRILTSSFRISQIQKKKMKLSIAYLAASAVAQDQIWDGPKELAVIAAVQDGITGDDLVLEDPKARSNKQWHDCGAKPALAVNGQSVECSGAYCVSVCPQGKF